VKLVNTATNTWQEFGSAQLTSAEAVQPFGHDGLRDLIPYQDQLRRYVRRPARMSRGVISMPEIALYRAGVLATDNLTLPSFVGIGGVRTGSTWLHHNLAAHPGLFLPAAKELHFFNLRLHRGLGRYARIFDEAGDRKPGEITPSYGVMPEWRIRLMRSLIPDARIVLIVRNPIDRAWSHAIMKLTRTRNVRREDVTCEELWRHFMSDESQVRGRFTEIIDRWTGIFPEQQLHVAFHDDIVERPKGMLSDIFEHIGVTTDIDWNSLPYTQIIDRGVRGGTDVIGSTSGTLPPVQRAILRDIYAGEIETLADRLGGPAKRWADEL
jgi:hypothetical protein